MNDKSYSILFLYSNNKVCIIIPMNKKRKSQTIYRYYEIPPGSHILALLGDSWQWTGKTTTDSLHFHNHMEIGYCYQGNGTMVFSDEETAYCGDMFTVIPQNFPHSTNFSENTYSVWEYLIIDVDGFLNAAYRNNPALADKLSRLINRSVHLAKAAEQEQIALLIRQIMEAIRSQNELYQDEANALTLAFLIRLAQWNKQEYDDIVLPHMENSTVLSPALDFISRHPEHPVKIEELAQMCHISEPHFRRLFADCMKMNPVKYINQVRIRRACDELKRTNDPVSAIAARTGFSTLSTFNRNFRHIMGISPQQWRKEPERYEWKLLEYDIESKTDNKQNIPPD